MTDAESAELDTWKAISERHRKEWDLLADGKWLERNTCNSSTEFNEVQMAERLTNRFPELSVKLISSKEDQRPAPTSRSFFKTAWFQICRCNSDYLGVSMFFILNNKKSGYDRTAGVNTKIIQPGTDKAILTLSDGRQVVLNDSARSANRRRKNFYL